MGSIEHIRRSELERALRLLHNGREARQVAQALSRRLMNKLLHEPTKELRKCTGIS